METYELKELIDKILTLKTETENIEFKKRKK